MSERFKGEPSHANTVWGTLTSELCGPYGVCTVIQIVNNVAACCVPLSPPPWPINFNHHAILCLFSACQKIVQQRLSSSTSCLTPTNSRPSTPNNHFSGVIGGAPRHHQPAPSPTNNGFIVGGVATTTSSSSPHTSGGSPASNVIVGNASPSHAQTLSHKVCGYTMLVYWVINCMWCIK